MPAEPPPSAPAEVSTLDDKGNLTAADYTIQVPLPPGFTTNDAITALSASMTGQGFDVGNSAKGTGTLRIAGNNISAAATWSNFVSLPNSSQQPAVQQTSTAPPVNQGDTIIHLPGGVSTSWPNGTVTEPQAHFTPPAPRPVPASENIVGVDPVANTITISPGIQKSYAGSVSLSVSYTPAPIAAAGWEGLDAAVATLNSAMQKATSIDQTLGDHINLPTQVQTSLSNESNALAGSAGALIDANMPKVGASLVAAQIRQLASQSLSLSNQAPQLLLQLFK